MINIVCFDGRKKPFVLKGKDDSLAGTLPCETIKR